MKSPVSTSRSRARPRAGSALVATLFMTLIVTTALLAAGYRVGMDIGIGEEFRESQRARLHADAAAELAVLAIAASPAWRSLPVDPWVSTTLDGTVLSVSLSDPTDGILPPAGASGSSDADTVRVTASATRGDITRSVSVDCLPYPHESLRFVGAGMTSLVMQDAHIEGRVMAANSVNGANVELVGDVYVGPFTVTGGGLDDADTDIIVDDALPTMPLFDTQWYVNAGEEVIIPENRWLNSIVLSATHNPYGLVSVDAIYWMDAGGIDLNIMNSAFDACLVILNASTVTINASSGGGANYHHVSPDPTRLPALIVDGDLTMSARGGVGSFALPIGFALVNFSREMIGVFAATGAFTGPQADATGRLIVEGSFVADNLVLIGGGEFRLRHLPALNTTPIAGIPGSGVRVLSNSTTEVG